MLAKTLQARACVCLLQVSRAVARIWKAQPFKYPHCRFC